jgi:hypothetical protein
VPALVDTTYEYQGYWKGAARCRLRLYRLESGVTVAIVSELSDNPGTSITNYAAELATLVRGQFLERGQGLLWVEHYPGEGRDLGRETFDRVTFRWDGRSYDDPEWHPSSRADIERLIGEPLA